MPVPTNPPPSLTTAAVHDRYAEVSARLNKLNALGAASISLLTLVERWGDWRDVVLILAVNGLVIPWNTLVNLVLLKRLPHVQVEVMRSVVNLGSQMVLGHYIGMPFVSWLWLPYVSLAFDPLKERTSTSVTLSFCVFMDAVGIYNGVDWRLPATFTLFALFCLQISKVRFGVLRTMLLSSDRQRVALAEAHGSLSEASVRLQNEMRAREHAEIELRHAQKLEAVGRLAAGIAHEINTPVQFVGDNVQFLQQANSDLLLLIEHYRSALEVLASDPSKDKLIAEVNKAEEDADLVYLVDNLPRAITATREGLSRIAVIVRSMKEFAHPNQKDMMAMDLNQGIRTTLTIAKSEYKHVAEVETELAEELPSVTCFPGDVNQALLNIIVNAAHAIGDVVEGTENKGLIRVRTRVCDDETVEIAISDTGGGIPEKIQSLIFDPFFTTKEVGRGTGQGLAIARTIVVEKHGGTLTFETKMGEGTTFYIRLPFEGRPSERMKAAARAA